MSPVGASAVAKLTRMLGPEQGAAVAEATMRELGVTTLQTPEDCLRFGEVLIRRGGLLEAIGRAIKIQAILNGAQDAA